MDSFVKVKQTKQTYFTSQYNKSVIIQCEAGSIHGHPFPHVIGFSQFIWLGKRTDCAAPKIWGLLHDKVYCTVTCGVPYFRHYDNNAVSVFLDVFQN